VIDFIDMDERRNNTAVEKRMKDKLKTDRARIQVGRISGFGLMEMSRQRLRPGMIEATTQPCPHCHGTGLLRSDDNLALSILRQLEEEGVRGRSKEVLVKAPVGIINFLINNKREHIAQIEERYGLSVRLEGDPVMISPDFSIEKYKTATRRVAERVAPVVSVDSSIMDDIDDAVEVDADEAPAAQGAPAADENAEGDQQPRKRRRRRRRRRGGGGGNGDHTQSEDQSPDGTPQGEPAVEEAAQAEAPKEDAAEAAEAEEKPKKRTRTRRKKSDDAPKEDAPSEVAEADAAAEEAKPEEAPAEQAAEEKPKKRAPRKRKAPAKKAATEEVAPVPEMAEAATETKAAEPAAAPEKAPDPEPVAEVVTAAPEPAPVKDDKPKKKGWWSMGR
ncbi:MAG: ribonuclease E/G, partial [Pseudomonadota bacterium]